MTVNTGTFYDNADLSVPKMNGRNPPPEGDNANLEPVFNPYEV